jgi:hypothetical protein
MYKISKALSNSGLLTVGETEKYDLKIKNYMRKRPFSALIFKLKSSSEQQDFVLKYIK